MHQAQKTYLQYRVVIDVERIVMETIQRVLGFHLTVDPVLKGTVNQKMMSVSIHIVDHGRSQALVIVKLFLHR